jgi:deazaflavin-dependent oxidoreductase (nitroreductase family)
MTHQLPQAPAVVRLSNRVANALLRIGIPMGPNTLVTIRGRTSGLPRSMPLAVMEMDGRRWIIGAYGDVQWTRNLRATKEADIEVGGTTVHVTATELEGAAADHFFVETLPAYVRRFSAAGQLFARVFFAIVAPDIARDPARAAATHPVFELHPSAR